MWRFHDCGLLVRVRMTQVTPSECAGLNPPAREKSRASVTPGAAGASTLML